ncbi:MAG: arsenic resistance N-acetyltransferase ArsN2 [Candidatus Thorarchaeota archaeon]|jgi:amino-acid N-acetyltransferase
MTNHQQIENASKSDFPAIVALLQDTDLPPDGIEPHLDNFLVIRNSEQGAEQAFLMGCAGLEVYGNTALLRSVAVHPDSQGIGLGTRLVKHITQIASDRGIIKLFLLTDTAEDYFKKLGFSLVSRDMIPEDVKQSIEFTTLCTESPSMMKEI